MLSKEEIARYNRHLLLPEIGMEGQQKLKQAKVLVIGAGGLGCPALSYLCAAGAGKIGIVDFDGVDESNLQRQILYSTADIGKSKAIVAAEKLQLQNPHITIIPYQLKLDNNNALAIISEYDFVIDGTDNFATRYLVNDACLLLNKPLVYGSVYRFEGQVTVFNYTDERGNKGPTYRCLFPKPPAPETAPNCSQIGVLGILPGIIGSIQACEAIKLITGVGELLSGKLLLFNALSMSFQTMEFLRDETVLRNSPQNKEAFLSFNYDYFCNNTSSTTINTVTANELIKWMHEKQPLQLLDVREKDELPAIPALNDLHIPLGEIKEHADKIARDKKTIVFCRSGMRSKIAIGILANDFGFTNLYNLEGGAEEWMQQTELLKT
ncbi:MAG: molybdopterin-synthase adenylyltransferase MoeB [Bacteroidia bacterium]